MYEYKYIKIDLKAGINSVKPKEDYHKIIDEHAAQGWQLVQIFAPPTESFGASAYFELIFSRIKFK